MTEPEATTPESPPPANKGLVDLSDLRMMPSWVAGMGSSETQQQLRRFEEREGGGGRGGDRGDRRGPRRDGGGFGGRERGEGRPPRRDGPGGHGGGPRRDRNRDERGGPRHGGDYRGRHGDRPQREWQEIPKDVTVVIEPEDKSAEALASHIRSSGHAFSMFDAARLVLAEGDRFHARFTCAADRTTPLYLTSDGGLFLTHDEALQHVLRGGALEQFYRVEEIELEEPKGDFKSVGVCGMTGELLGPPSHHSFQTALIRLHRERFSHMPLEDYKRRVRVEANPDLVTQWKENQKKGCRWVALKPEPAEGEEPVSFSSRAEMELHFRRTHAQDAVREAREVIVPGNIDKSKMTHVLFIMLRQAVDGARKHLFEMSQKLGGSFERRGLKLFKRRAGKLFVSRVKPRAVDPGVVLSDRVAKIVEVLKSQAGMPLHHLVEKISPSPVAEGEAPPAEGAAPKPPTDEQITVIKDVRWLANEGYVIEYSDGMVFLGVQGEPNPPKSPAGDAAKAEAASAETPPAPASEAAEPAAEDAAAPAGETTAPESGAPAETPAETTAENEVNNDDSNAADSPTPPAEAGPADVADAPAEEPVDISAAEEPVPPVGEETEKPNEAP
jgi:hypothetical protein